MICVQGPDRLAVCVSEMEKHTFPISAQPPMKFHLLHRKSLGLHAARGQRGFSIFSSLHFLAKSKTHIRVNQKKKQLLLC